MNVNPPGEPPLGASGPPEDQQPQYQIPPKEQFPRKLQDEDEGQEGQKPKKAQKKKHRGKQAQTEKLDSPMALLGQGATVGAVTDRAAEARSVSGGTPIDRLLAVFQNNQLFGAGGISNVSITERADASVIGVSLENGVEVNINLSAGQELNITISGLTAAAQSQADNIENQMLMREKLAEQGFIVHQVQTFRGEGTTGGAPTAPPPGEALPAESDTGERGGGGNEGEPESEGEPR